MVQQAIGIFLETTITNRPYVASAVDRPRFVDQVKTLAAEVMAHLRDVTGPEALLGAYNAARAEVKAQRVTRRTRQKLEVRQSVHWGLE
jgi:hypothetical protein